VIALFQPDHFYPTVGASGGVFGLLLAFAMFYPRARLALIFVPIPVPAPIFVAGYMILELFLGITGTQAGVAHFAHLGGAIVGFVLIQYWRAQAARPSR
jgi:membrane associated rhomboid family serine protease